MASSSKRTAAERLAGFKARAGGRWAISWQAYALSVPVALLASVGAIGRYAQTAADFWLAVAVALGTCAAIGALLYFLAKTIYKNSATKPVSLWVVSLSGLSSGTVFSVGIALGKALLGANFFDDLVPQIIANSVLISWWGVTVALVLDSTDRFSRQRDEVIEAAIETELVKVRGSATEQRLRESMNKVISSEISQARSTLNAAMQAAELKNSDANWQPISGLMRDIASDVMRPLSKKLWDSAAVVFPRPNFIQVLRNIVDSQPLRPLALTIIAVLLSASTLVNTFGQGPGLTVLGATVAYIWLAVPPAMAVIKRNPSLHRTMFIVTIFGFQIFDTLAWMWAGQQAAVEVSFGTLAVNVVACAVLILLTSGFGAFSNVNEASLRAFRQDVSNKQLAVLVNNKVVSTLTQEASRNLHGRVQTRLLSCAAAIDRATASGDFDLLNRALIEVNDIFDNASLVQPEEPVSPLGQQLAKISKHWDGLCAVNLNLDKSIEALATKTASDIADIFEEAITNAVRHGKATQADIRVEDLGAKVTITVSDNGLFATDGTPGVGTELIRLLTRGDFSITKNALGGATLRATLLKAGY
jgi:hypothetical protein